MASFTEFHNGLTALVVNDKRYRATMAYQITISGSEIEIHPTFNSGTPVQNIVNQCEHCGRGDWQEVVYHSIEEAVADGFLVEI